MLVHRANRLLSESTLILCYIRFGQVEQAVLPPGGISRRDWLPALASPRSISRNKAESGRQRFVCSLSDSGIRRTKNGESFGKYAQIVLTDDVNYRAPSDKENRKIRHEKINPDPYTKRAVGRVAATPARQNKPVSLASCTTQARARCPLEYPHLAVASAYGACARTPFAPRTSSDAPASILNLLPRPIATRLSYPYSAWRQPTYRLRLS